MKADLTPAEHQLAETLKPSGISSERRGPWPEQTAG
jgi:hypothetical protein